jgi:phosphoribosylpyrophosphate synthetase
LQKSKNVRSSKLFVFYKNQPRVGRKNCSVLWAAIRKNQFQHFSDGEFEPVLEQSVRGRRVFLIASTFPPADNLLEFLLMIDAAKRASAKTLQL